MTRTRLFLAASAVSTDGPEPLRHWLALQLGLSVAAWGAIGAGLYCVL